jgi:lysophospholipase L1-like esterase
MRPCGLMMAIGVVAAAIAPACAAAAQGVAPNGEVTCPPLPEALARRRTAIGEPPPPSAEDVAAYRQYSQYLQANDWAYLCRYRDENHALPPTVRPRLVMIGDSITENWKQRDPGMFADGILDRGISGQTSPQMLLRFHQDVIALQPRIVHIMAGTNDIAANTGPTGDEQFRDNIRAMVELARAHRIKVILASIPPAAAFSWRPGIEPAQRIRAWNDWLRGYARTEHLVFVDYHAALTDDRGGLRREFGDDGVHPSHAGYQPMDALLRHALADAERR